MYFGNSIGLTGAEKEKAKIINFCTKLQKRKNSLSEATTLESLNILPCEEVLIELDKLSIKKEQEAQIYQELENLKSNEAIKKEIIELEARKWLNQNKTTIVENVAKMKTYDKYRKSNSLTNTQALSLKKSSLSDELITAEYIKRFQDELQELGGNRINVTLVKTRATRGRIYHQIQLKNNQLDARASDVLSEGEFRIVSLAGFLADVEGNNDTTPFIFDDPISSLDQLYEEATIRRIARLSLSRQVIVFTHRLSFLALLEEAAKDLDIGCEVISLRSESWGTGEPGENAFIREKSR